VGARVQPGMKLDTLRARTGARYLLIAAMCAITATACGSVRAGSGSAAGSGSGASAGASASASAPKVSLDITLVKKPGAKPQHWTLRCDPPGGTHPDPAGTCKVLLAAGSPFAPLRKHLECPMIRVGSATATIKGMWFGKKVDAVMTDGGCSMARWTKIGQVFN
jgi:Subtilisin inhibitor-like